jgi:vacuolar-type H+-ATPase subunit D/Vma8
MQSSMIVKFNGGKKERIRLLKSVLGKTKRMIKINKISLTKNRLRSLHDQCKNLNSHTNLLDMFKKLLQFQSVMINFLCFQQELTDASNFGV